MFCKKCGNEIGNNAKFCPICGASFAERPGLEAQVAFNQGSQPKQDVLATFNQDSQPKQDEQTACNQDAQDQQRAYAAFNQGSQSGQGTQASFHQFSQTVNEPNPSADQAPPSPKQRKKRSKAKIILLLIVILLAAAAIGGTAFYFTSPAYQLSQNLSEGDYSSALDTYTSSIKGSSVQKWLANRLVSDVVSDIVEEYEDESISYEEALTGFDTISQMTELDVAEEAAAQSVSLQILYASGQAYDLAEAYYEAGDYEAAMDAYQDVDESDSEHYEDAQSKIESARENYRVQIIEKVGSPSTEEEYETAISLLNSALAVLPDDEELITLLENCETELQETIKATALSEASDAIAAGNYEDAFDLLETALNTFPEDSDLTALLTSAQSQYVEYVTSQVAELATDGDYKEAFDLLETALKSFPEDSDLQTLQTSTQSQYEEYITSQVEKLTDNSDYDGALELIAQALVILPDSTTLKELQTTTEESQPVKLSELKISDSYNYELIEDLTVYTDVVGNVYNLENLFKTWVWAYETSYADYYLNDQYTRLTGTIAVSDESASNECTVTIYGDGTSVLYTGTFSRTTAPVEIDIDLTGVEWFEIQVGNHSGNNTVYILLSDFVLYKE